MVRKNGFTLMELLVVIALIGILTAIATVSYSSIQKRSRDSHRINDLKYIQQGFEQYYQDTNYMYPTSCGLIIDYLPNGIPSDPSRKTDGVSNSYSSSCGALRYCFCAELEVEKGNSDILCGNDEVLPGAQYYCVNNLQ